MEFKQWLNEEYVWNLSSEANPDDRDEEPGLFQRATNSWIQGLHNVQQKRLWANDPGGGPNVPTPKFPTINGIKQAFQGTQEKEPNFPIPWEQAKQAGLTTISPPQTIQNSKEALTQAFEAFIQSIANQNYTPEMQQVLRKIGYSKFLNPASPQPDASGNITFEFVIPKPEKIR